MSSEDDVHIHASMDGDVASALEKAAAAAKEAERALESAGRAGVSSGDQIDHGMTKAKNSTQRARDAAGRFIPAARGAGDAAAGAGAKAAAGSVGFDKWARSADKASKSVGGLKAMLMLIKWGTILTGGQAVIAMLASLGAGLVMAAGHAGPLIGVVGVLGPGLFLLASTMGLLKISGKDVAALMVPLLNDFKAMRYEVTQALVPGIQQFTREIHDRMIPTFRAGFTELGGSLGRATALFGDLVSSADNTRKIGVLFHGMDPIIQLLAGSLGKVVRIFINLAVAALPMTTSMAQGLDRVTTKLDAWAKRMTDSGKAQAFMMRAWDQMKKDGRILRDLLIGLYNIFRIAGGVARDDLGGGLETAAAKFRAWTSSAEGGARILKYFQDSVPTLKETGLLVMAILRAIAGMGANPNTAALIKQIRTELLPAVGAFLHNISGATSAGFGSALVSGFTAVFNLLAHIPLGGLTTLISAIGTLATALGFLVAHVPGLGSLLGLLLSVWVVAGAGFKVAAVGLKAFGWLDKAIAGTGKLSLAQKTLGLVLRGVGPLLTGLGNGILWVGRAIGLAFASNPLGVIIIGIIALIAAFIWAYNKFDWFRNGVNTVVGVIVGAFVWMAKAAAQPFIDLWNIIKAAYNFIAKGWNSIPEIHVPDWVPLIGGSTFGLPKMPMLAHGGVAEHGAAIVGEHGPEPLVAGGRFLGMVGTHGPELRTDLPPGGYVVPNLDTLTRIPGLTRQLPGSVADAVASALPSYGAILGRGNAAGGSPPVTVNVDTGADEVVDAIHSLAAAVMSSRAGTPPPVDTKAIVRALRASDSRDQVTKRYTYSSPRRP